MSASIRGDKGHVRIVRNGQQIAWFEVTGLDSQEDTQLTESYYCGSKNPESDGLMMGWSGSVTGEVKNNAVESLIMEIRQARKSGVALPQVNIIYHEEYPDGGVDGGNGATYLFTDVQLTYGGRRAAGAPEKITKTLNFKASDMVEA